MKKGTFIKLDFTGKLLDGTIFDTTQERVAEEAGITGEFAPKVICVGERMLLKGLDDFFLNSDEKKKTLTLQPEDAFGKKDSKLLQIVPQEQLKKQGINPQVGMQLNIDGQHGVVKKVGGGRTIVDFNHPLAGHEVIYDVEVVSVVDDPKEQILSIMKPLGANVEVSIEGKRATLTLAQVPPQPIMDLLQKKITGLTSIETVSFEAGKK